MTDNVMKYNILKISIEGYLNLHWQRTRDARRIIGLNQTEWNIMWTKNYYQEKCEALEKELTKVKARLVEVLKEKLDEM